MPSKKPSKVVNQPRVPAAPQRYKHRYKHRELAELQAIYAISPDPNSREVSTVNGEIDLTKSGAFLVIMAQNRAIGAMLDELLSAKVPPKRKRPIPARRG